MPLIAAGVPPVVLVLLVLRYKVDVPVYDQWDFVPLLEKAIDGSLSFWDFWAQHSEHRQLFPRMILLPLARASGWNTAYELLTSIGLAFGILVVFAHQTSVSLRVAGVHGTNWLIPITSLVVFSLAQWGNWLVGWQVQTFLNVLAVGGGLTLLCRPGFRWSRFLASLALGIVATYSYANGLAYWAIGFLVLLLVFPERKPAAGLWLLVGSLVVLAYFCGYRRPPYYTSPWAALGKLVTYLGYVLTYLGAPLGASRVEFALPAGLAGCLILVGATWWLIKQRVRLCLLAPYLALSLYAVCGALMTGLGRSQFGSAYALNSRYTTVSSLLWLSNAALLYLVATLERPEMDSRPRNRQRTYAATAALAGLALAVAITSTYSVRSFIHWHRHLAPARAALLALDDPGNPLLKRLWGESDLGWEHALVLKRHGLSVFRDVD